MNIKLNEAQVARLRELERDGRLLPSDVLVDARERKSPLHSLYKWDLSEAAQEYWVARTREIIRSVQVRMNVTTTTVLVPAYVRDPDAPGNGEGYRSVSELRSDPEAARRSAMLEFERAEAALRRAREVAAALGLAEDIDELLASVVVLRSKVAPPEEARAQ